MTATPALTVRPATTADIDVMMDLRNAMLRDMERTEEVIAAAHAPYADWLRGQLAQPERFVNYFGEIDGAPVACAAAFIHDWYPSTSGDLSTIRGYLFNVYTRPAHRRQGIAGQLVQACIDWCRARDVRTLSLRASAFGESVYAQLGFARSEGMPEMTLKL